MSGIIPRWPRRTLIIAINRDYTSDIMHINVDIYTHPGFRQHIKNFMLLNRIIPNTICQYLFYILMMNLNF